MSNSVLYDATKHNVQSVSVFQANRAEVNRRIQVELKAGQNEVEVTNLPSCLDQDSIRVDGVGRAIIFDVVYNPPPPFDHESHANALSTLNNRRAILEAEWRLLNHQERILTDYSKTLKGSDTAMDQLFLFLDAYEEKIRGWGNAWVALKAKLKEVDDEIREAQKMLNADEESLKRAVKITVIVLADEDGPAELSLTYMVSDAWWTPLYDLRAAIAHDAKSSSTVRLHYRASVTQSTGEDWANVTLTLSTASPLQGTTIPTLQPEWIGPGYKPETAPRRRAISTSIARPFSPTPRTVIIPPPDIRCRSRSRSRSRSRCRSRSPTKIDIGRGRIGHSRRSRSYSPSGVHVVPAPHNVFPGTYATYAPHMPPSGPSPGPPPGFFAMQDSKATEGVVSATFTITGLSSIPSNTTKSSQTHKVSIAEIELSDVELEWVTIPKENPSVFLQCKVQNTSNYVLLPGQTSIFLDNNFVSKSRISHVSPKESFSCSLGVDPAVRVTYHPQSRKSKAAGSYMFASKTMGTAFRQRTTIKNTRSTALHTLVLTDQVPVSDDARIKVTVLEPADLQVGKGAKETQVRPGVKARWAQKNTNARTMEEGGGEAGLGIVQWICEIGPGASVDVDLAWDVVVPAGIEWISRRY